MHSSGKEKQRRNVQNGKKGKSLQNNIKQEILESQIFKQFRARAWSCLNVRKGWTFRKQLLFLAFILTFAISLLSTALFILNKQLISGMLTDSITNNFQDFKSAIFYERTQLLAQALDTHLLSHIYGNAIAVERIVLGGLLLAGSDGALYNFSQTHAMPVKGNGLYFSVTNTAQLTQLSIINNAKYGTKNVTFDTFQYGILQNDGSFVGSAPATAQAQQILASCDILALFWQDLVNFNSYDGEKYFKQFYDPNPFSNLSLLLQTSIYFNGQQEKVAVFYPGGIATNLQNFNFSQSQQYLWAQQQVSATNEENQPKLYFIVQPHFDVTAQQYLLTLCRGVADSNNNFIGVINFDVRIADFDALLQQLLGGLEQESGYDALFIDYEQGIVINRIGDPVSGTAFRDSRLLVRCNHSDELLCLSDQLWQEMQKLEQQTTGVTVSYFNTLSTNHYALTSVPLATTYPITTVTQQLFRILLLANASELYQNEVQNITQNVVTNYGNWQINAISTIIVILVGSLLLDLCILTHHAAPLEATAQKASAIAKNGQHLAVATVLSEKSARQQEKKLSQPVHNSSQQVQTLVQAFELLLSNHQRLKRLHNGRENKQSAARNIDKLYPINHYQEGDFGDAETLKDKLCNLEIEFDDGGKLKQQIEVLRQHKFVNSEVSNTQHDENKIVGAQEGSVVQQNYLLMAEQLLAARKNILDKMQSKKAIFEEVAQEEIESVEELF